MVLCKVGVIDSTISCGKVQSGQLDPGAGTLFLVSTRELTLGTVLGNTRISRSTCRKTTTDLDLRFVASAILFLGS